MLPQDRGGVLCTFSMTDTEQTPSYLDRSEARIADLAALFSGMNDLVKDWKASVPTPSKADAAKIILKLGEMQTIHLMLLRAEEAFYEKIVHGTDVTEVDYDDVRDHIGRALDRIRIATRAEGVSEPTDG